MKNENPIMYTLPLICMKAFDCAELMEIMKIHKCDDVENMYNLC